MAPTSLRAPRFRRIRNKTCVSGVTGDKNVEHAIPLPFTGDLDGSIRQTLRKFLASLDVSHELDLDVSQVDSIDSTVLAELVQFRKRVQESGGTIELVNVNPQVRRLLQVTGLSVLFLPKKL